MRDVVFVSPTAFAADPISQEAFHHRFYASVHGGWIFDSLSHDTATDTDPLTGSCAPFLCPTFVSDAVSKPGYRIGGAIGARFADAFAIEGEVGYGEAAIDRVHTISVNGSPVDIVTPASGGGTTITGMVNAIVSLPGSVVRPYVGGGIGLAYFTANNIKSPPDGSGAVLNGSDTGFAYQLIAGADFAASGDTTVGARYRYMNVSGLSLMDGGYQHDFSTTAQSVEFVLTQQFGDN